jgi:threonine/homoserine/homoserine lactone efflux protein
VLLFALVAATSPLALASVLVVLTSGRGRLNGTTFAIGFVAGQAFFCFLAFAVGAFSAPTRERNHPTLVELLIVAFGITLLTAAIHLRRRSREPRVARTPNPRAEMLRGRLSRLSPVTALATGAVLGVGGPKRIGITLVVSATITQAGLTNATATALALTYVLVATVLVWVPVMLYVVFGRRAAGWLTSGQAWISSHKEPLTFYPSAVLGVVLVVDGLVQLTR